ncbi:lysis system i-spanin subunit Rz [Pseudomonas sp. PCH446]
MTFPPFRLLLIVLLVVGAAWFAFDQVLQQRDSARSERDLAQDEASGLREAARISGQMLADRDAIDLQHTQELNHARTENDGLRRAVNDARQRLLVKATCSAPASGSAGAGGLADGGTAELSADARPDYFALRDQLALSRQMILGLQDYVDQVCLR